MTELFAPYSIILASKSPRRQELLKGMDIPFSIPDILDVDESYPKDMKCNDIAGYLAEKKAQAYTHLIKQNTILLTADTIVICDDHVIHKPKNEQEAYDFISMLSGRTHSVITGMSIRSLNKKISFSELSEVTFSSLDKHEITYYIDTYKPYDKAGAYGVQEWIGYTSIKNISGSYFNVMGLPTHTLYHTLKKFITQS